MAPSVRRSRAAADPYAPGVTSTTARGEAISRMLDQAEAAPPVDAVEAVTHELGAQLPRVLLTQRAGELEFVEARPERVEYVFRS